MIIKKNFFMAVLTLVVLLSVNANASFSGIVSAVDAANTLLEFPEKSEKFSESIGVKSENYKKTGMRVVRVLAIGLLAGASVFYVVEKVKEYKDKENGVNQQETKNIINNYYIQRGEDEPWEHVFKRIDGGEDAPIMKSVD